MHGSSLKPYSIVMHLAQRSKAKPRRQVASLKAPDRIQIYLCTSGGGELRIIPVIVQGPLLPENMPVVPEGCLFPPRCCWSRDVSGSVFLF